MTKRFETKQDLINEEEVIKIITKNKSKYTKLGENEIDFLIDGKSYIEVKCSPNKSNKYKYQILSLIKVVKMQHYSRKLPTFLFYKYTDCIMYINVKDIKGNIKWFERKKNINIRNAVNDSELVVYIPKNEFKIFE